jgi:hypothetical protein
MFQECRHIMPSGARCHAPALRGKPYCYFHARLHNLPGHAAKSSEKAKVEIEILEDASAVQLAVSRVLSGLSSGRIESRTAGILLYGLQIAAGITGKNRPFADSEAVQDVSYTKDGRALARENLVCEPLEDCADCPTPGKCIDCKLLNILQKGTPQ